MFPGVSGVPNAPRSASGPGIERRRDLPMVDVVRLQQAGCEQAGSALYGRILAAMADDVAAGGTCAEILAPWAANALADAIPLRFLASVHRMALDGRAPELAAFFPSAGGEDHGDPVPAFLSVVRARREQVAADMGRGVQTNEVGRAAALVGGFHRVAADHGLPLRVLEVGSSAGLLLNWDRYRYVGGGASWGPESPVAFVDPWTGRAPRFHEPLAVVDRAGCDIDPVDVTTTDGVTTLRGFLWPDQRERRARLDAAIDVARRFPVRIDRADAGSWVEDQLRTPVPGVATVIHHSIVLQYLPRPSLDRMRDAIAAAGARATPDAPICWLRMEPAGEVADVRLRSWPGGGDRLLAETGYHGPPVTWLADQGT